MWAKWQNKVFFNSIQFKKCYYSTPGWEPMQRVLPLN